MSVVTPISRQRLPGPERRAQLLTAAASAFMYGGFGGTSMEQVADAAGVTRLIVYRNFATKEDLYRAVLRSVIDRLSTAFDAGVPPAAASFAGDRSEITRRVLVVARAEPDGFRLLWRHALHEPPFAAEAHVFRGIVTSYAATLLHDLVTDERMRRWAAASFASHVYDGICVWLDVGDPALDDDFVARMTDGLRALVGAWR